MMGEHFDNCISLGWFCGTASALSYNGLRNFSSPFDWCFSDFCNVLKIMKNDFSDFLNINNLKVEESNNKHFMDLKYNFCFLHEIQSDFLEEYPLVKQKYDRRITRFLQEIENKTCFFRSVRDDNEIEFITQNYQYILSVIKKHNSSNEIVFLLPNTLKFPAEFFGTYFNLNINQYIGESYPMNHLFDGNKELIRFCGEILAKEVVDRNINRRYAILDNRKINAWFINALEHHDLNAFNILKKHIDPLQKLYIYGGGYYGKSLLRIMVENNIEISAVIDVNKKLQGTFISGIPCISLEEITENYDVFISVSDPLIVQEIKGNLIATNLINKIITYSDLYEDLKKKRVV